MFVHIIHKDIKKSWKLMKFWVSCFPKTLLHIFVKIFILPFSKKRNQLFMENSIIMANNCNTWFSFFCTINQLALGCWLKFCTLVIFETFPVPIWNYSDYRHQLPFCSLVNRNCRNYHWTTNWATLWVDFPQSSFSRSPIKMRKACFTTLFKIDI